MKREPLQCLGFAGVMILTLASYSVTTCKGEDKDSPEIRIASDGGLVTNVHVVTEWFVAPSTLEKQPRWDGLSSPSPLDPGHASKLAVAEASRRFTNITSWSVRSIYLRNLVQATSGTKIVSYPNVWCYQIFLSPTDSALWEKLSKELGHQAFAEVVLLDKTIPQRRTRVDRGNRRIFQEPANRPDRQ